jgi:hypothetical protein
MVQFPEVAHVPVYLWVRNSEIGQESYHYDDMC